ncbi:MAG: hypothetical protein HOH05_14215 [Marinovum sp.]|jgi:hypothetical protein|nr:hypothetical protein [Marinovum sp.]MBT6542981.1 hypothetical protein [Paracoccaceae bacterium]
MWGLTALFVGAGLCVIGFHLVSPNFRNIRLSMAHLMPPPPKSQAPKKRFSLRNLVASWLFWLRLLCVALIAMALYPLTLAVPLPETDGQHFRLVFDVSASMGVENRNGQARIVEASALGERALEQMTQIKAEGSDACIDVAFVAGGVTFAPMPQGLARVTTAVPDAQGSPMATLVSALTLAAPMGCNTMPTHVVVVSDQPPQTVNQAVFNGHLIWQQVGVARDNLAIWSVDVVAATLRETKPMIDIRVASFGTMPGAVTAEVEGPNGVSAVGMRRDETRAVGWRADVAFDGAGTYRVRLLDGGALLVDDAVEFELGAVDRVTVDWRLDTITRPSALMQMGKEDTTIVVAAYQGVDMVLPDGPFVLVYDGWVNAAGGTRQTIGPFMRDHPILAGVNFDVLERVAPRPVGLAEGLGLAHVIRPDAGTGTWVGVRDTLLDGSRGAIVPLTFAPPNEDISGLSRLMFYNALSWVAEGHSAAVAHLRYVDQNGATVPNARAESNTARVLSDSGSLSSLRDPVWFAVAGDPTDPIIRNSPATPWLIFFAMMLILLERLFGLIWNPRGTR